MESKIVRIIILAALGLGLAATAAEPPANPWTLANVLARVPPLAHDATGRLPMITAAPLAVDPQDGAFEKGAPLPESAYRELLRRGLAPHIPLKEAYIPMALAIQAAGVPVIVMEGEGGNGPGAEAADTLHQLPDDYVIPQGERRYPCPLIQTGWQARAAKIRAVLGRFKAAGVRVTAVWLDWEVEPLCGSEERRRQVRACARCREMVPGGVLWTRGRYEAFILPYRQLLLSTYVAEPILEDYPAASVSNWESVFSSRDRPYIDGWDHAFPPMDIGRFTASMPAAYGSDAVRSGPGAWHWWIRRDTNSLDRLYTHVMLAAVSSDAENARLTAPDKQCVPWVARFVQDTGDARVPVMSRARYREVLRHIWLRGADTMQVFNPFNPRHPDFVLEEVEDAAAIYDEMLAWRPFLERGLVMNTEVPGHVAGGVLWSGLRLDDEALVRVFTPGASADSIKIRPWKESPKVKLAVPPQGATYRLVREGRTIRVTPCGETTAGQRP